MNEKIKEYLEKMNWNIWADVTPIRPKKEQEIEDEIENQRYKGVM